MVHMMGKHNVDCFPPRYNMGVYYIYFDANSAAMGIKLNMENE